MSPTSIVTVLDGHPDSLDAVRWAAWLSQETRLPLCVVHAFAHQLAAAGAEARAARDRRERARARGWLRAALDPCPSLPHELRLVVAEGDLVKVVGQHIDEGSVLVCGSHGPADLLAWGCRIRGCPVVLVPATRTPDAAGLQRTDPNAVLSAARMPA